MGGMRSCLELALSGACLFLAEPASAVELCPSEIATKQRLEQELEGWESRSRTMKHTLKTVLVFDGHPSKQMSLKHDEVVEREGETVHAWRLHPEAEYWLQCEYSGTTVVLARRAPPGVKRCEVAWAPGYRKVKRLLCK